MRLGPSRGLYAAVAVGGMAGGLLRMLVFAVWPASQGGLPLALLAVNATGSGVIGLVLAFSEPGGRRRLPVSLAVGLMAGFCGALTTLSTFSVDVVALAASGPARAGGYVLVSLVCWLVAAALGLLVGRRLNAPAKAGKVDL